MSDEAVSGEAKNGSFNPETIYTTYTFGAFFLVGLILAGFCAKNWCPALLWAFAFAAAGSLIGFLFGIPRVIQRVPEANQPGQSSQMETANGTSNLDESRYQVNTNLVDVSDWLTKIIVGLGLVELRNTDDYLIRATGFIAPGLDSTNGQVVAGGIILYFSVLGFLGGYIMTRLVLAGAFARADRSLSTKAVTLVKSAEIPLDDPKAKLTPKTEGAARKIAAASWADLKIAQLPVWAKAKMMLGNADDALKGFATLVELYPGDITHRLHYAHALFQNRKLSEAFSQAKEARSRLTTETPPPQREACYAALMFYPLYVEPDGYKETIRFAQEYREQGGKLTGAMWVNLASAYGQEAKHIDKTTQAAAWNAAKMNALDAVKNAIRENPVWKERLKELLSPASPDAEDNDLVPFQNEEDFRTILLS